MRLRPAAVIVRSNQHHRDIEFAFLDRGDLESANLFNAPAARRQYQ